MTIPAPGSAGAGSSLMPGPGWIGGHAQAACPYPSPGTRDYPDDAKKRPADYGRPVPVFPSLHEVTCGRAVNRPVDNYRRVRLTAFFLWIPCG